MNGNQIDLFRDADGVLRIRDCWFVSWWSGRVGLCDAGASPMTDNEAYVDYDVSNNQDLVKLIFDEVDFVDNDGELQVYDVTLVYRVNLGRIGEEGDAVYSDEMAGPRIANLDDVDYLHPDYFEVSYC